MTRLTKVAALALTALSPLALHADNARFDLIGPKVDVRVTRGGKTLPIAEVPNLQAGDKLWVKAELPDTQSNHLILVVAFLRGTTNEPPDNWFTEIDSWEKKNVEGTTVVVPDGAEQALMFIAPETGGDFKTLRSAVKGKPGLFIRADSDLNEASFEQQRIERYLAEMKKVSQDDQKAIQDHSAKLAATLALKPNADCFKQPVEQQINCLTQSSAPLLMDDGHGQGIADALSSGATSDFINAASYTQAAGAGVYSAYVGAVVDLVHLVTLLHTAKYQYIPGLNFPQGSTLNLKLNAPPSFVNPKSVIVIGLPAIQAAKLPPLKPQNPNQISCLLDAKLTLPLAGAPLVFATSFAHDLTLHVNRTGAPIDIPLTPDPFEGGLAVAKPDARQPLADAKQNTSAQADEKSDPKPGSNQDLYVTGTVKGYWGFDTFDGPTLTLQQVNGKNWKVVSNTQLLAGQDNKMTLQGEGTSCVQKIDLTSTKDQNVDVSFKPEPEDGGKPQRDKLALDVPLKEIQPGGYSLAIKQFGDATQDKVSLTAYNGDIHLDGVRMHEGDDTAVLTGKGLGNVAGVQIADQDFTPAGDSNSDELLHLQANGNVTAKDGSDAEVKLKDGRTMKVKIATEAARPGLTLVSFNATPSAQNGSLPVLLSGKDEIPLEGKLTFVVQTKAPFPRNQIIEIANGDGSLDTKLSLADSTLVLQDEHTAIGTLSPQKAFGESAFGKLQMRPVSADGTPGNWTTLGTLVRTPQITAVRCTDASAATCTVDGNQLFLVQAFGAEKDFAKPADVPSGFAENSFTVPTPSDGDTLFLKLRDDPQQVASVKLPTPLSKAAPATVATGVQPPAASGTTPGGQTSSAPAGTSAPQASATDAGGASATHSAAGSTKSPAPPAASDPSQRPSPNAASPTPAAAASTPAAPANEAAPASSQSAVPTVKSQAPASPPQTPPGAPNTASPQE